MSREEANKKLKTEALVQIFKQYSADGDFGCYSKPITGATDETIGLAQIAQGVTEALPQTTDEGAIASVYETLVSDMGLCVLPKERPAKTRILKPSFNLAAKDHF